MVQSAGLSNEKRRSKIAHGLGDQIIKEVTGEHFFTKYNDNKFKAVAGKDLKSRRSSIMDYEIPVNAKCICFCEQRLGKQKPCPHQFSTDIDEISKIIEVS